MIFLSGNIGTKFSMFVHDYNMTRVGLSVAQYGSRRVVCDKCGQSLMEKLLASHLETQHGLYRPRLINQELLLDHLAEVYVAHESAVAGSKHFFTYQDALGG